MLRKPPKRRLLLALLAVISLAVWLDPASAAAVRTERISVTSSDAQTKGHSISPSVSGNGRFVAFAARSTDLTSNSNGHFNVYVHDKRTGATSLVSIAPSGEVAYPALHPSISESGRYVAFSACFARFEPSDTTQTCGTFVRDLSADTTTFLAPPPGYSYSISFYSAASISANGRYVAVTLSPPGEVGFDFQYANVFLHDMQTGTTTLVSRALNRQAAGASDWGVPSNSGRYVAFVSSAPDLVRGGTEMTQVYVRDMVSGTTQVISQAIDGRRATRTPSSPLSRRVGRSSPSPQMPRT